MPLPISSLLPCRVEFVVDQIWPPQPSDESIVPAFPTTNQCTPCMGDWFWSLPMPASLPGDLLSYPFGRHRCWTTWHILCYPSQNQRIPLHTPSLVSGLISALRPRSNGNHRVDRLHSLTSGSHLPGSTASARVDEVRHPL